MADWQPSNSSSANTIEVIDQPTSADSDFSVSVYYVETSAPTEIYISPEMLCDISGSSWRHRMSEEEKVEKWRRKMASMDKKYHKVDNKRITSKAYHCQLVKLA